MNNNRKCHWCEQDAIRIDYRTVDAFTSKIVSCDECFELSTEYLIERINKKEV